MKKKNSDAMPWSKCFALNSRATRLLFRQRPKTFLAIAASTILSALTPYATIYLSAQIVNELAGAREPGRLTALVLWTLGVTALLALLSALLKRWKNYEDNGWWYDLEKVYSDKLFGMDYSDLDNQRTHDLLLRIRDLDNWSGYGLYYAKRNFEQGLRSISCVLGALSLSISLFTARVPLGAGLSFLNHPLCNLAMLLCLLAFSCLPAVFSNKSALYMTRYAGTATLANRLFSYYSYDIFREHGHALDHRIYRQDILASHSLSLDESFSVNSPLAHQARGLMGLLRFLANASSKAFTGIAYIFASLKAWAGAFGVGSVTQYIGAITALSGGMTELLDVAGSIRANGVFLQTCFELLDTPNQMYQGSLTTEKRSDRQYEVEFRDVSFRYPNTEDFVLRHVNLKFQVGKRLAVVGRNGSGKTTFIKLLCRLYDPTEGVILLNGIDIRKYRYDDYMSIFSVVFQDFKLLSLPLAENVAAQRHGDRARVTECLQSAGFGERLASMLQGIDTPLNRDFEESGVQISGGEGQKIAIARALYKDAPFIILDEPTAALDPVAEAEIYTKFDEIAGDKTAIYISHRLSSCRFCDEIVVFDGGQVVQQGSHDDLLADESGLYAALWHAQAQYYEKHDA